jgi:hypothetical protein
MAETYHDRATKSHRAFVVTRYGADRDGRLMPEMPQWCVRGQGGGCRLRVDHFRERKTGPCFALAVVVCREHRLGFTLYPPGHVPYGRVAIAPVGIDGSVVLEPAGSSAAGSVAWGLTVFGAALDAAAGIAWPRTNEPAEPRRWWRTQGRYLGLGGWLLALAAQVRQRQREQVAQVLGIALLVLLDGAAGFAASGYRGRGRAIVAVLSELTIGAQLGDRLLASGSAMGLWGEPSRWDPGGEAFRPTLRALTRSARS